MVKVLQSEALRKQGSAFPSLLINMIKSSEMTGTIEETLDDMSNYYQELEETKKAIISAVAYPLIVLTFAFLLSPSNIINSKLISELGINLPSCGACLSNMAITPGGNVVPCQSWLSDEPLGNMLTDEWEKIWSCHECESLRNYSAQMTGRCPLRRYC